MIKNKKIVLLLALIIIFIPTTNVFAENLTLPEEPNSNQENKHYGYDQEIINESIRKDNERAEKKWNEMLKNEGIMGNDPSIITVKNNSNFNNLIVPNAFKNASVSYYNIYTGEKYIFNSTFDVSGSMITEVYSVDVWSGNSNTSVSNKTIKYKMLDGNRTIAANFNFRGGYKDSNGTWHYNTRTFYVEFYYTGGAVVY